VTVSNDLRKVCIAVWAHLHPVVEHLSNKGVNVIHFISDSPSGQYRNRFNAHMLNQAVETLGLKHATWNFAESGHGKGAPDGVGAAVKRAADQKVALGFNIRDASDFVVVASACQNVLAWTVSFAIYENTIYSQPLTVCESY
jgi:hypothetical protein